MRQDHLLTSQRAPYSETLCWTHDCFQRPQMTSCTSRPSPSSRGPRSKLNISEVSHQFQAHKTTRSVTLTCSHLSALPPPDS
ncbi:hypothetical protein E2C01_014808 [Portunus trituberculatus]|uniref:Uncharacterized protein n=1 Tax=Portunus trituberculatus TaxID=210409 RepID=A0A5B7DL67_PORTR|nr:hypothetical protein [Portunus trituberculatus]